MLSALILSELVYASGNVPFHNPTHLSILTTVIGKLDIQIEVVYNVNY